MIFFSKCSKVYVNFENAIKFAENVDGIEDNCVWTCSWSFCQLWQKYMWSAPNVLKISPKIWGPTKWHDTQLDMFDINGKLAWKCCRADFGSLLDPLTRWFPKDVYYVNFKNLIKFEQNVDCFEENCIWTCCGSFCQLWTGYIWSAVNALRRGPKFSDPN